MTSPAGKRLLLFNLKTDADDDILGFTTDWINAIARHFEHVHVITMDMGTLAVAPNVTVQSVGKERGWSEPRRVLEFYRLLYAAVRRKSVDACFAHMMPHFVILGGPVLRLRGIPITLWYAHKSVTSILRVATLFADRVLTSTPAGFRLPTAKLRVIGQGIDTRRFAPVAQPTHGSEFNILHVGRLSPIKQIETLIDTAAQLIRNKPGTHIVVTLAGGVGTAADHVYERQLRDQAQALGIADHVRFLGSVPFPQVRQLYVSADCMVNPSVEGALDKTVLEAMSCGLPIVTSNASYKRVVGEDLDYWVVGRSDPVALAERISRLIEMPVGERRALGARFRAIVERDHDLVNLAARIAAEIEQTVQPA